MKVLIAALIWAVAMPSALLAGPKEPKDPVNVVAAVMKTQAAEVADCQADFKALVPDAGKKLTPLEEHNELDRVKVADKYFTKTTQFMDSSGIEKQLPDFGNAIEIRNFEIDFDKYLRLKHNLHALDYLKLKNWMRTKYGRPYPPIEKWLLTDSKMTMKDIYENLLNVRAFDLGVVKDPFLSRVKDQLRPSAIKDLLVAQYIAAKSTTKSLVHVTLVSTVVTPFLLPIGDLYDKWTEPSIEVISDSVTSIFGGKEEYIKLLTFLRTKNAELKAKSLLPPVTVESGTAILAKFENDISEHLKKIREEETKSNPKFEEIEKEIITTSLSGLQSAYDTCLAQRDIFVELMKEKRIPKINKPEDLAKIENFEMCQHTVSTYIAKLRITKASQTNPENIQRIDELFKLSSFDEKYASYMNTMNPEIYKEELLKLLDEYIIKLEQKTK